MTRRWNPRRAALAGGAALVLGLVWLDHRSSRAAPREPATEEATQRYLAALDVDRFRRHGSDYAEPSRHPDRLAERFGRPAGELDDERHYDFEALAAVENALRGVDRHRALRAIYDAVTAGYGSDTERHLALHDFLVQAIHHQVLNPTYPDSPRAVLDPLVLLELGHGKCGRVAGLAVDLWRAGGGEGRRVALAKHVVAELRYDGDWHLLDADNLGVGQLPRDPDGAIPSVEELSREPGRLDARGSHLEPGSAGRLPTTSPWYPSFPYFGYLPGGEVQRYRTKRGTPEQEARDRSFGWTGALCEEVPAPELLLPDLPRRYQPGAPRVVSVTVADGDAPDQARVTLAWEPSEDRDGDLLGYRVFVSRTSRGWSYAPEGTVPEILPYLSHPNGWDPTMRPLVERLPASEVALVQTEQEEATLRLARGATYYVTVAPFDAHGEAVGRTLYRVSQELAIAP